MCRYLGNGNFKSSIEFMAISNIEVTDVRTYNNWLKESWSIVDFTQKNKARDILVYETLSDKQKERVWSLYEEDAKLYDHIIKRLKTTGRCSIFGEQLI
ncbi:MAG: hypothetical protein HWD60_05155 [Defluviicoccus sp.]|nr:MAG: hypothetical protein HWD60_05155 [Defluviicoccus sp.]